jgi:hypothetical protein
MCSCLSKDGSQYLGGRWFSGPYEQHQMKQGDVRDEGRSGFGERVQGLIKVGGDV